MNIFYTNCSKFEGKNLHEKQHNAGRYIVEYAAKQIYKIENPELEIINKKPFFKFSNIKFSISHSDNMVAVCFSQNNVGFDIQKIIQKDYSAIAKRMNFKLKEDSLNEFYTCWTTYEAKYKLQEDAKSVYSQVFKDEYIISVASSETTDIKEKLNFKEIIF